MTEESDTKTPRTGEARSGRRLLVGLAILFLASSALFWLIYRQYEPPAAGQSLDFELAKALLQIGVVSVAAAVVTILVFDYQHRRQADQRQLETDLARSHNAAERERELEREEGQRKVAEVARLAEKERDRLRQDMRLKAEAAARRADYVDELLKSTLTRITTSYNAAKRARRALRALARVKGDGATLIRVDVYDEWMAKVNDAQLDLEAVKRDVQVSKRAYPSPKDMADCVKRMEKYLRDVTREYEKVRCREDAGELIPLAGLDQLRDFLGQGETRNFRDEFTNQYAALRRTVRENLLHARFDKAAVEIDAEPELG